MREAPALGLSLPFAVVQLYSNHAHSAGSQSHWHWHRRTPVRYGKGLLRHRGVAMGSPRAPLSITPTAEERRLGRLLEPNIRAAVEALAVEGVVVLQQVVSEESCEALNERILRDYDELERCPPEAKLEQQPEGGFHNNWQGGRPPPCHPYLFTDVAFNEFVLSVTQRILGPLGDDGAGRLVGQWGLINTAFAERKVAPECRGDQAVHIDANATFQPHLTQAPPHPPSFSVNLPLLDQTDQTGATEYWPGTHNDLGLFHGHGRGGKLSRGCPDAPELPTQGRFPSEAMIAEWEAAAHGGPPKRTYVKRGDAIIRDPRVWHRGTANRGQTHRAMVSCGHSPWRRPPADDDEEEEDEGAGAAAVEWPWRPEWQRRLFGSQLGSFTAPADTAEFWSQHPLLHYNPLFIGGGGATDTTQVRTRTSSSSAAEAAAAGTVATAAPA
jgi:hypothetical protein